MKKTYGSSTAKFAEEYVALDDLRDQPAMITFEKSIWGGDDPAERCDARWYWSYTNATVNANMRVAYSNDGGASFTVDGSDPLDSAYDHESGKKHQQCREYRNEKERLPNFVSNHPMHLYLLR